MMWVNQTHAQQKIRFCRKESSWKSTYKLPISVTCTFKNGQKKHLILNEIKGDSLIFEKYYNQPQVYDCSYTSLKKITIHFWGDVVFIPLFFTSVAAAGVSFGLTLHGYNSTGEGMGSSYFVSTVFGIPATLNFVIMSLVFAEKLPRSYKPENWKMNEK